MSSPNLLPIYKILILIGTILYLMYRINTQLDENFENFKSEVTPAYLINLDRHQDRRTYMEKQFQEQKLAVNRFSAFDKKKLDAKLIKKMKVDKLIDPKYNPPLDKYGSVACLISHTNLYKKIKRENKSGWFLIFEDDCKLEKDFKKKLQFYMRQLPPDAEMVWFGYNKIKGKKVNDYFYRPNLGFNYGHNSQHHCYLIKYEAIDKILDILLPVTVDFITKDSSLKINFGKFRAYFCIERLAVQDAKTFPISERTEGRNG